MKEQKINVNIGSLAGGAWQVEAMKRIKAYLENALHGVENAVILG
jgi:hypothetical protein